MRGHSRLVVRNRQEQKEIILCSSIPGARATLRTNLAEKPLKSLFAFRVLYVQRLFLIVAFMYE